MFQMSFGKDSRRHLGPYRCQDCGDVFMSRFARYCNTCLPKKLAASAGRPPQDGRKKPRIAIAPNLCMDCRGKMHDSRTGLRCQECHERFEDQRRAYECQQEARRQMAEKRVEDYGFADCQQPLADRHPECFGRFLRTQSADQSLCIHCQRITAFMNRRV